MKLHLDAPAGTHLIRGYTPGALRVGESTITTSAIVTPAKLLAPWRPATLADLVADDLEPIFELGPELVLLGTGSRQQFPPPSLLAALYERRIGVEVMDTAAACRTYNVLVGEGRAVAAALIVGAG